jgi:5-hydroxyisourate hydrolase-like protein (transthyretin family)
MKKTLIFLTALLVGIFMQVNIQGQVKGKPYQKEWKTVDSLNNKGLPKSALEMVEKIYTKAKADKNNDQIIKAVLHRMKYINASEEHAFKNLLDDIDKEIAESTFPNQNLLYSIKAEMYWMYYNNNRYRILERTNTIGAKTDDIETWTLDQLTGEVIKQYLLSLENRDSLIKTESKIYEETIKFGSNAREIRPTLYDFLAQRAFQFFQNTEVTLTRPADFFQLKEANYFGTAKEFTDLKVSSSDSLSLHYQAVVVLQDWLKYRLSDNKHLALVDLDLKRLQFVYHYSVHPDKDQLYLKALEKLQQENLDKEEYAEISYYIAQYYNTRAAKYNFENELTYQFKYDKKKALEICENAIEKYPKSYGAQMCKSLKAKILSASLNFTVENQLAPNQRFPLLVNYRNISKVYTRIGKIDPKQLDKLYDKHYGDKLYEQIKKSVQVVQNSSFDLKGTDDYNTHNTELLMNQLPIGTYVVFVANNEKFDYKKNTTSYSVITVTGLAYIQRTISDGSIEYHVMDRTSGKPLKDVKVKAWYEKYNYTLRKYQKKLVGDYTTDAQGYFKLQSDKKLGSKNITLELFYGADYYNSNSSNYLYYRNYQPSMSRKVFLFTDRAIYRPGQTIYYKGIMLNSDGEKNELSVNSKTSVILYDVNHQKVATHDVTTNEFGSFSGSFEIPRGLLNGNMQLYCYYGSKYVSVEEYKRPKFKVEVLPLKGNYVLNDSVKVSGKAVAFAGSMITDAQVKYRIVRKPVWRGWWYWRIPTTEVQMAEGIATTNEKGEFDVKFVALPDLSYGKSEHLLFSYDISVDVTDLNGETHSASKRMLVGYTSLQLNLDLNAKEAKENINKVKISTTNVNGEFVEAKGEVKIYSLKRLEQPLRNRVWDTPDEYTYTKDSWNQLYAGNEYNNENDLRKREKDKLLLTKSFNTENLKELDLSEIKGWETGVYVAESTSEDAFGNKIEWKNYFTLYSLEGNIIPDKVIDWFVPVKTTCEPGEKAKFLVGSSISDIDVIYEIEHRGDLVKKEWLKTDGNQKVIEIPITEEHRGNLSVHFTFLRNNRLYKHDETIIVPRTNKELDITFETFRDKLYPGQDEEWKIKIKGKNGEKVAGEMLATLYDASLDQFRPNNWNFSIYRSYYSNLNWKANIFGTSRGRVVSRDLNPYVSMPYRSYDYLNWFGFSYYSYDRYFDYSYAEEGEMEEDMVVMDKPSDKRTKNGGKKKSVMPSMATKEEQKANGDDDVDEELNEQVSGLVTEPGGGEDLGDVKVRTNFNETAFFYPHLETNAEGEVIVKFKIPESLTSWKMMGFAHTKDLKYGFVTNELKTQKDLMLLPNEPRFFRQNDMIEFPVKISNLTKNKMKGVAQLELFDAITMKPVEGIFDKKETAQKNFEVDGEGNTNLSWKLQIPDYIGAVTYKVVAKAGNFSDGEQKALPVLSNRMMVTESLPLPIRGKQTKDYELTKLVKSKKSGSLKNFKLTLEYSSNPAWYAIQALPYIMEYPYECAEQTFSRLYANSIASHIANSSPKVKRVFDSWKNTPGSKALLSNLEKNQELKSALLEETPWVLQAGNETERKHRIGVLFDLNRMADELGRATIKLQKTQSSNGGWPWFEGMPESRYITQHIVTGFGHLDKLGVKNVRDDAKTWQMVKNAINYLDDRIREDYNYLKRHYKKEEDLKKNHLSQIAIHYLYGRSFFKDIEVPKRSKEAYDYYMEQSEKYWLSQGLYSKGMLALYLSRYDKSKVAADITKSLREFSTENEEMGRYWKDNVAGYYWYQAPIETHALMIEVFNEVAKNQADVDALKVWLLKQKQTQDWKTTKATTEAVYALLLTGANWLESDELVKIKLGDEVVDPKKMDDVKIEAGTGYFKTSWGRSEN